MRCSRWALISSVISLSRWRLRNNARNRERNRGTRLISPSLSRTHHSSYRERETNPGLPLYLQLFPSRLGEAVILGAPIIFGLAPLRFHPASAFQAIQSRIERTLSYAQHVI